MKKLLRFSLVVLFAVFGMSNAFAGKIVFAEITPALENGVQYSDPFDGGDFTVTFAGGGNNGKYYTTGSGIRVYGGGTMTITAKSGKLTKILVTYDGTNKPTSADVVDGGTYDPETGLWTGNAETVVFTRPTGSGHWRIKAIATNDDAVIYTPKTIEASVADALTAINALADNGSTQDYYKVTGYVVGSPDFQRNSNNELYGNVNLKIADEQGGTSVLTIFRAVKDENGTKFGEDDVNSIKEGDKVVFQGTLKKNVYDNVTTPELIDGYLISVTSNIQNLTIDTDANAPVYSLDGRRVDQNYRGVVIQNGQKKIQK